MYAVPEGYANLIKSTDRVESIFMSLGIDIDNTAADDIISISGSSLPMTNTTQLVDAMYEIDQYLATFEGDGIPTASTAHMITPPISPSTAVRTGWWSSDISDADGGLNVTITIALSATHTSALTVYTDGPNILAGTVTFINGQAEETVALTVHNGLAVASGSHTYDTIRINITEIDQPYHHLRIAEFEFGDSITISTLTLANSITYIDEIDPFQQGLPMRELDFDLINVNGEYDEDNPNTLYQRLAIGNPISLSYTFYGPGVKYTIPMSRFVIAEKMTNGNCVSVVAYDTRWYLSQMYNTWSISTAEDLGTTLDRLFTSIEIAHTIDPSVYDVSPLSGYTFGTDSTVLEDIMMVGQAYGITFIPNRVGTLMVGTAFNTDSYGDIPPEMQFSWPESNQMNRYNYIDILYGTQHYIRDLRPNLNTARVPLTVGNRLITTETHAVTVCNRIVSHIYGKAIKVKWASDPAIDLGDTAGVFSQWTLNGTATVYKALKREITFDGMLTEETTFIQ